MSERGRGEDARLGMGRPIDRRDFLNGVAVAGAVGGASLIAGCPLPADASPVGPAAQDVPGYQPALKTGLRGSHPGSFEDAHRLRDGDLKIGSARDTGERYDLIVVGGGLSGLSAAHFWRQAKPNARILILDNHDDFGGHAKRNEFHLGGKTHLMNGGTLMIDSPFPYSGVSDGLLKRLGVDPPALAKAHDVEGLYSGLGMGGGVFFDRETFGTDRLVAGAPGRAEESATSAAGSWSAFLAKSPLSAAAQRDVQRVEEGDIDYLPGLDDAAKKDALSRISYRDYLLQKVKVSPLAAAYYQSHTQGEWGVGIDGVSALDCWAFGLPGFKGLKLKPGAAPRMSYTPSGYVQGGSYRFHFPDGNATLARLLVRALIPAAMPGDSVEDVVTARADYGCLDRAGQPVRIRLSSIVVRAQNLGGARDPAGVRVTYIRGGRLFSAQAGACVMASWNMMIPYLIPDLPPAQQAALHDMVKIPLVYTTVALRNWEAFKAAGVSNVRAPGGYHTSMQLNPAVDIGGVTAERDPTKPILLRMTRTPCMPGLPEHDQNRAGRAELLSTSFETFERNIRDQLGRTLAATDFDPARDITGIIVNRWPHGYAPEYNALWQPDLPLDQRPNVIGRQRFGRIAIANSDASNAAYTDSAIDQAWRAVGELLSA